MDEFSSIIDVGATSFGVFGTIDWSSKRKKDVMEAMIAIAGDISAQTDGFYGHVKTVVSSQDGWTALNLIDLRLGVDIKGELRDGKCNFKTMAVALDVDKEAIESIVMKRLSEVATIKLMDRTSALIVPR